MNSENVGNWALMAMLLDLATSLFYGTVSLR